MERCRHCEHELMTGFEFCHHCGASIRGTEVAESGSNNLVEVVDSFKGAMASSIEASRAASEAAEQWLGARASVRRIILSALATGFTLALIAGLSPASVGIVRWLESGLVLSILLCAPISYWITGFIPFSNHFNTLLGDTMSIRRRIIVSLVWMSMVWSLLFLPRFLLAASQVGWAEGFRVVTEGGAVGQLVGAFIATFYLMGFANSWRALPFLEFSIFRDEQAADTDTLAERIQEGMQGRTVRGMHIGSIEMSKLRRFTAGETSASKGLQLVMTHGRTRVIVFVQDFGGGLFIRWKGYYDASGRRLWVLLGLVVSFFNDLFLRWTGTSLYQASCTAWRALSPASNENRAVDGARGGGLARLLGLLEGISEYTWNELYALEGAVSDTVVAVVRGAEGGHREEDAYRAMISRGQSQERNAMGAVGAGR